MKEVSLQDIEKIAEGLAARGADWHYHVLTPACNLNSGKNVHAVILEDLSARETYVAYSAESQTALGRRLVALLHRGRKSVGPKGALHDVMEAILDKAREMNRDGLPWHYHRLCPGCMFNRHHGEWVVMFEDETTGEFIKALFDEEPAFELDILEELYFKETKKGPAKVL